MGISWKTMPLLSTLAALVIIVHSAEDDFEPDYRDVRPRRYDTATTHYEQPWRILDMEPVATQTTQADWPVNSQEEPPKRRKLGRKRKRRPPPTSEEDLIPQERNVYNEEYRPYQQEKFNPQSGIIRRRRKQFDVRQPELLNTWTQDTVDADRPLIRKRGHRRKRPLIEDPKSEINQFDEFKPNDDTGAEIDNAYIQPTESTMYEVNHNYDENKEVDWKNWNDKTVIKDDSDEQNSNKYINFEAENYNKEYIANDNANNSNYTKDNDKSLSEFSLEIGPDSKDTANTRIASTQDKLSEKIINDLHDVEKAKSNETLDPHILKQILKKSNGRSLSEILQQHNLSLADFLHGKEKAISILLEGSPRNDSVMLKDQKYSHPKDENNRHSAENIRGAKESKRIKNIIVEPKPVASVRNTVLIKNTNEGQFVSSTQEYDIPEPSSHITMKPHRYTETENVNSAEIPSDLLLKITQSSETTETTTKSFLRRRFPVGVRRKLRMRPLNNNTTYKSQLSRDLIALTSRRYQVNRNTSRSRDWKEVMPTQVKITRKEEKTSNNEKDSIYLSTTIFTPQEDITTQQSFENTNLSTLPPINEADPSTTNDEIDNMFTEPTQTVTVTDFTITENIPCTTTIAPSLSSTTTTTTTEMPTEKSVLRPLVKPSDLRRQAFNNRLKRKRLKQKSTTTEPSHEYAMKNIFGMANLVSASEFIAKVQPRTTISAEEHDFTNLEDFITTETSVKSQIKLKSTKPSRNKFSTTPATLPEQDIEIAKFEIEEILNDTRTSARLSKILMERNMTINELVEHRERGSSHIHLADIFHNASKEPNPPEPFLSKSLIEPISKETYPLRALLEANLHDPTAKATSFEPNSTYLNNINIPVVMDFGNNVNENGENMGIMSLFDNFTKIIQTDQDLNAIKETTIEISSHTPEVDSSQKNSTVRESRTLNTDKDFVSWKEIIAMMHKTHNNKTNEVEELTTSKDIKPDEILKKIAIDLDSNDDSLIMVNDLHHLNVDSNIATSSQEDNEEHPHEKPEPPQIYGTINKTSESAKSVTVATASIIGLAMVLFLLTYVAFKWKQQRNIFHEKQTLRRDRIPTPVFENRKSHKINSSTRSKSPMISSSNIYSIDTLETRNGNDSPEYMWDSLRKPFQ